VFFRGDCDQSQSLDLTDPIFLLGFLFLGDEETICRDACDVNDDEQLNLTDAIFALDFLFRGGRRPPQPFPLEGVDPSGTALRCLNGRIPFVSLEVVPRVVVFHRLGNSEALLVRGVTESGEVVEVTQKITQLVFSAQDEQVATVDPNGRVTATGSGETVVTASALGTEVQTQVRVLPGADGSPVVRFTSPGDGAIVSGSSVQVAGVVSQLGAELTLSSPETGDTSITADFQRFSETVPLALGANVITVAASTKVGENATTITVHRIDVGEPGGLGPDGRPFPQVPPPRSVPPDAVPPSIKMTSPTKGSTLASSLVDVEGTVDDPDAEVRVNGVVASVASGQFTVAGLELGAGDNILVAEAVDLLGNRSSVEITVTVDPTRPQINLEEPVGDTLLIVSSTQVTFRGTVLPADSQVLVNEVWAVVNGTSFTADLTLEEGLHDVVIRADPQANAQARGQIVRALLVDQTAPQVEILYPPVDLLTSPGGFQTVEPTVTLVGRVFDPGVPVDTGEQIELRIDGSPQAVTRGSFALTLAVAPGPNVFNLEAEDVRGNTAALVLRIDRTAGVSRVELVTGNNQTVEAGASLAQPLVARALDGSSSPLSGVPVTFRVVGGAGVLQGGVRSLEVTTNGSGEASVAFTTGTRAGSASQVVTVIAPGTEVPDVAFVHNTTPTSDRVLVAHGPKEVTGVAGELQRTHLAVRLLDNVGNSVTGTDVVFRFVAGVGSFVDGSQAVRATDGSGVATALVNLARGDTEAVVEAETDGAQSVRFRVRGLEPGAVVDTSLAGSVLDDRSRPIVGAIVRVVGLVGADTTTDGVGAFFLSAIPDGDLLLEVDGGRVVGSETPDVGAIARFKVSAVAGRSNTLPEPLRLAHVEDGLHSRVLRVSPQDGGILTVPSLPGFRLEVPPGSVVFPDGSRTGTLRVVHPNLRVAHGVLPDRVQPETALAVFPSRTQFSSDVRLTLPNLGFAAGARHSLYERCGATGSYLEMSGSVVSEDGVSITTLPGSVHRGSVLFFAVPGPDGGTTGSISGELEFPVPGLADVPQRRDSYVVGFQVYAHSGEFFLDAVDLEVPGRGLPYRFRRHYESRHAFRGSLGWNWEHEYADRRLSPGLFGRNVVRADGRGTLDEYLYDLDSDSYVSPVGVFSRLFLDGDGLFVERLPDGTRYRYYPLDGSVIAGRLESIAERRRAQLSMVYDTQGRLEELRDTLGRVYTYSYDDEGRIDGVVDFEAREVLFEYDDNGDLVAVTGPAVTGTPNGNDFPQGRRTEYVYSSGFEDRRLNHNLLQVIDPVEVAAGTRVPWLTNQYRESLASPDVDRVIVQQWGGTNSSGIAAGGGLNLEYVETPSGSLNSDVAAVDLEAFLSREAGLTRFVDREQNLVEVRWNGAGLPLSVRTYTKDGLRPRDPTTLHPPAGVVPPWFERRHRWTPEGLLATLYNPGGDRVEYEYDSEAPLRYSRSQVLVERRYPVPDSSGVVAPPEITQREYEPLFGQEIRLMQLTEDGDVSGTTRWQVDYQEAGDLEVLAAEAGVTPDDLTAALTHAGVLLGQGELNEDGLTNGRQGNRIREELPATTRSDGSVLEAFRLYRFNSFGQITSRQDANGVVTRWSYYSERDPDGDGVDTPGVVLDPSTGGYLRDVTVDPDGWNDREPVAARTSFQYDPLGNISTATDANGNDVHLVHNALGELVEFRLPPSLPYRRWYFYDAGGRLARVQIENYRGSASNAQIFVFENIWLETDYVYDLLGQLISVVREVSGGEVGPERSVTDSFRYDGNGNLVRRINGESSSQDAWVYDERGLLFSQTLGVGTPEAATHTWHRDENGNVLLKIDAEDTDGDGEAEVEEFRYDGHGRLVAAIDPAGGVRVLERDFYGLVVSDSFLGSSGGPTPTGQGFEGNVLLESTWMDYDERGRLIRRGRKLFGGGKEVQSLVEEIFRDAEGRELRRNHADGTQHEFVWDAAARLVEETRPSGVTVERDYDANGNVVEERTTEVSDEIISPESAGDPDYDDEGRLVLVNKVLHVYDALDRRLVTVDESGGTWRARYDSVDNLVFVSDAESVVVGAAADAELAPIRDRLTVEQAQNINSHGNRVRYLHDNVGRLAAVDREMRPTGTGVGDIDLTNVFNLDGLVTVSFEWQENRLVAWTDDRGQRTQVDYDAAGIPFRKTWPDGSSETWLMDRDGNPRGVVDRNGSTVVHWFDALDRLVERSIERESGKDLAVEGTTAQHFEYDGLSRSTLLTDDNDPTDSTDDSVVVRRYDSLGRLTEECQDGFSFAFEYDSAGRVVLQTYGDSRIVETPRGPGGAISLLRDEGLTYASYRRFNSGRAIDKELFGRVSLSYLREDGDGVPRLSGYDGTGNVLRQVYLNPGSSVLVGFEYGRDTNGFPLFERKLHLVGAPGDVWRYDSVYRVRRFLPNVFDPQAPPVDPVRKQEFEHDGSHNWRTVEIDQSVVFVPVDDLNRFLSFDGTAIEYDACGNVTRYGSQEFVYDALGRVVRVLDGGEEVVRYRYDATGANIARDYSGRGRRIVRDVVDPVQGQLAGIVGYKYVGDCVAEERDGEGNVLGQYFYDEEGRPAVFVGHRTDRSPETFSVLHDGRGSVSGLVDASGILREEARYGLHGELNLRNVFGNTIRYTATGNGLYFGAHVWDFETGLHSVGARYFVPEIGRHLTDASPFLLEDSLAINGYLSPGFRPLGGEVTGGGSRVRERMGGVFGGRGVGAIRRATVELPSVAPTAPLSDKVRSSLSLSRGEVE